MKTPRMTKAVREAELRLKFFQEYASDRSKDISRDFARDQMRRELAVLIATARARLMEVTRALRSVSEACNDPAHFLFELLEQATGRTLASVIREIDAAEADLSCVVVPQPALPDFLAVAKGYADNWKP